ncbi:MAG: BlaI/MecI/CopY family transcriptional regulator [Cognaticolwellia sp.]|jgi:predicted transcriptional regulator|uniref:BlaI/MecI/CopY family transcriptional regulator n=1 Tax=Colwellia sp. Arc7-635 TaxID=2497879 RepID=UPI000F85156C|nr:BlaI/MecI/CopY family transcriptional regulator [Colwellia sp. Arc7-635]AZQ85386.1 BlaI/MecI/CopY family transcriptional regulator [Colwellia sp. Arc7-635]
MPNSVPEISDAEFEVLDSLWQKNPASANDIITKLNETKPWHEKTVKTLLNRLVKKQAITYQKQQRSYLYSPLIEREHYLVKQSKTLVDKLFRGHLSPLVTGFAQQSRLKKDDIAALKAIIADWEQEEKDD